MEVCMWYIKRVMVYSMFGRFEMKKTEMMRKYDWYDQCGLANMNTKTIRTENLLPSRQIPRSLFFMNISSKFVFNKSICMSVIGTLYVFNCIVNIVIRMHVCLHCLHVFITVWVRVIGRECCQRSPGLTLADPRFGNRQCSIRVDSNVSRISV